MTLPTPSSFDQEPRTDAPSVIDGEIERLTQEQELHDNAQGQEAQEPHKESTEEGFDNSELDGEVNLRWETVAAIVRLTRDFEALDQEKRHEILDLLDAPHSLSGVAVARRLLLFFNTEAFVALYPMLLDASGKERASWQDGAKFNHMLNHSAVGPEVPKEIVRLVNVVSGLNVSYRKNIDVSRLMGDVMDALGQAKDNYLDAAGVLYDLSNSLR